MKHIKTYEIFEEDAYYSAMTSGRKKRQAPGKILYRTTVYEWILELLKNGHMDPPKGKKFMSFSWDENSGQGDSDEFGDIRVDFDAAEIKRQGGIEVEYTEDFFKKNPDISMYVTGYKNKKAYEISAPYSEETPWDEYIDTFKAEEEVVLKKLKMTPKLIKKVTIWDADQRDNLQEIKKVLKGYKLNVDVPWE